MKKNGNIHGSIRDTRDVKFYEGEFPFRQVNKGNTPEYDAKIVKQALGKCPVCSKLIYQMHLSNAQHVEEGTIAECKCTS